MKPPIKAYVSGPMRGKPSFNFPTFDDVSAHLRGAGWRVWSPAEHDREVYPNIRQWAGYADGNIDACPDFNFHESIAWDLRRCTKVDAIIMLPGWGDSSGAAHERYVGEVCGKDIYLAFQTDKGWHFMLDPEQVMVTA